MKAPVLLLLGLLAQSFASLHAENWPQWRGPNFNGSTSEQSLPSTWDKTNNVRWAAPLPGYAGSTPIIWGDHVFLTSPDKEKNLLLLCLDRKTGKELWRDVTGVGNRDQGRNNMASPSPVTDGKTVVAMFGTGDIAAYDFQGKKLWSRNLGKDYGRFSIMWIYGSSPLLFEGRLYIQVLQRTPVPPDYSHAQDGKTDRESYLLCLDPKDGKELFRSVRPSDATKESQEAYSTPIPFKGTKRTEILVVGGNFLTGHDPKTGAELWRAGGLNNKGDDWWRIVPSPVTYEGLIFACGPKRDPVLAIREGGSGLLTETNTAWSFKEFPSDCPTPVVYNKHLFVLDGDRQMMTCLNPKTGEKIWQGSLGVREIFRGSPTAADGKLYCISERGTVVVLGAGDKFEVLSTIRMEEEPVRASIAASQGALFIRTAQTLYCIGNPVK